MKYLMTIWLDSSPFEAMTPDEQAAGMQSWFDFNTAAQEAGVYVDGHQLAPGTTATTVAQQNGERLLSDGPFVETKEQLAGYYLLDCGDLDSALDWAARIPAAADGYGTVEVRPVVEQEARA